MTLCMGMPQSLVLERFTGESLHPLLRWMNQPSVWRIEAGRSCLLIEPDPETDFWQQTHYGFRADNGHFLFAEVAGDCIATAEFHCFPSHQFDQAGLMARFYTDCRIKISIEFEPDGPIHPGSGVTNAGFSDWAFQQFPYDHPYDHMQPGDRFSYCLRLRREGRDFLVVHAPAEAGPLTIMRIARLAADQERCCKIGL